MSIHYEINPNLTAEQFVDILRRSTLADRRPVEDGGCVEGMLRGADLICCAWEGNRLVGVARSVTDFSYCCYLSDLAVDVEYQNRGIGKELIAFTFRQVGPRTKMILLAAPAATEYYPKIGFETHESCWVSDGRQIT